MKNDSSPGGLCLPHVQQVKQLDDADAEFDAELLIQFITDIAKAVAAISGKTKVLLRGQQLAASATETLQVCSPNELLCQS